MDEIEDVTADSSAADDNQPNNEPPADASPEPAAAEPPKQEPTPFHEHPRFKELVDQKNGYQKRFEEQGRSLQQLQQQLEQLQKASTPKQQDALMERLKGIDPEFADRISRIGSIDTLEERLSKFEEWQSQQEVAAIRNSAVSMRDKFWNDNKVPEADRELYNDLVTARAPKSLEDLPGVLKQVHEMLSKRFQSVQREATKQLVTAKKEDAQRPSSAPRGQQVKPGQRNDGPVDPTKEKAQLVKDIVADMRAQKDI